MNSQDVDALIDLGILEFEYFHDHEKALIHLEKGVQLDPRNVNALFWLAMCLYHDFCEYQKAEDILKEAFKIDPDRPDCLSLMGSIIRFTKRPLTEAIEYVEKAILSAPDWPMLRYQLAGLFLDIGDIQSSELQVQKAFKIRPLDSEYITNEVKRYYEYVVTGRSWNDMKKEFFYILEGIQKAKQSKPDV